MPEDNTISQDIRIVSISQPKAVTYGKIEDFYEVLFKLDKYGMEFPIIVGRNDCEDGDLIKVARHYLAVQSRDLANAASCWIVSHEEWKVLTPALQKRQSKSE